MGKAKLKGMMPERWSIPAYMLDQVGIFNFKNRQVTSFSGEETQKVALARALTLQPKQLLLDKPFSHLDQSSMRNLNSLISDI